MDSTEDKIQSPCLGYLRMAPRWELPDALLGGTLAMREGRSKWLPQEPKESSENYSIRLGRAILFNGFKTAVDDLVDRPFARPLTISGELGDLEYLLDDCTRTKRSLNEFAKDVLRSASIYGLTHILVEFPTLPAGASLADEQGKNPYFVHIDAPCLIGWELDENSQLLSIRFKQTSIERVGSYGEKVVHKIVHYTRTDITVFRKRDQSDEYDEVSSVTHTFGSVPLVTIYLNKQTEFVADPPLEDLAFLNLAHWQSSADQRNILRFTRIGILFASGFKREEYDNGLVIGPNYLIKTENPDGKLSYVEHSGRACESGERDLAKLERQMEVMGLQPVIEKRSEETATGKTIDDSNQSSSLRSWVGSCNRGLTQALLLAGQWKSRELNTSVALFDDFGVSVRSSNELSTLLNSRLAGEISRETFLEEMKRRGVLNETLDIEEEVTKLEADLVTPTPGDKIDGE